MKINLKPICLLSVVFSSLFLTTAFATSFYVEGETKTEIANSSYNVNPWNTVKITGVGEGNRFTLMTSNGVIDLPLSSPLYKISDYYKDRIVLKDGVWGVERMVAVKSFDGNENWQLYEKKGYTNENTVVFSCKINENIEILDGFSSHFDMYKYISQKTNIYDGISFSEDKSEVLMRFMNVRDIKTVEELKTYLKTQTDNGTPVKLYYIATESVFEPFAQELQEKLNHVEKVNGFTDPLVGGIKYGETFNMNETIFLSKESGNTTMDRFMAAISDCAVYNPEENLTYFINGIRPMDNGIQVEIKDSEGKAYTTLVSYMNNFTSPRGFELLFRDNAEVKVRLLIDLSKIEVPKDSVENFDYDKTGLSTNCNKTTNLILPKTFVAYEDELIDFNNAITYKGNNDKIEMTIINSNGDLVSEDGLFKVSEAETIRVSVDGEEYSEVEILIVDEASSEPKTVMFLGDSLINQDFYTQYFMEMFNPEDIELIGTRGVDKNLHEGRGGWAAYDYCNIESKYGFTNPFLLKGEFNFAYYMTNAKKDNLDVVVINLGINDINMLDNNSKEEIVGNLDKIIKSIKEYDSNVTVILNTPIMPFGKAETEYAKEQRLEFTKFIMDYYENQDLLVSNMYLRISSLNDFKYAEPVIDENNQNHAFVVNDTTHLNVYGYKTMAAGTYNDINYFENNK